MSSARLHINWIACDGHGLCAELLPELMDLDEWGFPVFDKKQDVPAELLGHAEAAVRACPAMALRINRR